MIDPNNIDYIITDSIHSTRDYAAIVATKINTKTKAVYFCHGADAFEAKSRYFFGKI